jgi:hypothetical protein
MSNYKLAKSKSINHNLKVFSNKDIDKSKFEIISEKFTNTLLQNNLEVSLYNFNNNAYIDYTSKDIKQMRSNHFLSKYEKTKILKTYGVLTYTIESKTLGPQPSVSNNNNYIIYEQFDFTLEDYYNHKYEHINNKRIPTMTKTQKKKILFDITDGINAIYSLGYDIKSIKDSNIVFIKDTKTSEYSVKLKIDSLEFSGLDIDNDRKNYNIQIDKIWDNPKLSVYNSTTIYLAKLYIYFLEEEKGFIETFSENIIFKDTHFYLNDKIVDEIILKIFENDGVELLKNMLNPDAKHRINTTKILLDSFWKKEPTRGGNYSKFRNTITDTLTNTSNCNSCSTIPISKEIYIKHILEATFFEEIHQNYKDVMFKETNIDSEMRVHLFKVLENVFKFLNLNEIKNIDQILIKELDAFINALMYIRLFVDLKQKMELSVLIFMALWSLFSKKYINIFIDFYKLINESESIKYIDLFNKNVNIESFLNVEYIPITTHLNYIISKLAYESKDKVNSENIIKFDLMPVYLNLSQYYSSVPNGSMDYFSVYEICIMMLISTPLFINNFNNYNIDKFIEQPPYDFLKVDLDKSRKFIDRFMRAKKTLFKKLPSSDNDSNLIVDYDFIHLTNSLAGNNHLKKKTGISNYLTTRLNLNDGKDKSTILSNNTEKLEDNDCSKKLHDDCKEFGNGCKWVGSRDIGKCFSRDSKIDNCELKNENDCRSISDGLFCYWENHHENGAKCLDKEQSIKYCSKKNKKDCSNKCKWTGSEDKGVCLSPNEFENKTPDEKCSYKNEIDCNSNINGIGCDWINDKCISKDSAKKEVVIVNHCKKKNRARCLKWFNGCKWLENNEGKGTCFLKEELEQCEENSLTDCDKKTCVVKYNKCVPKEYNEIGLDEDPELKTAPTTAESIDNNPSAILKSVLETPKKKNTWYKKKNDQNEIYYENADTDVILMRGEPPSTDIIIDKIPTPTHTQQNIEEWEELKDDTSNRLYYYNRKTTQTLSEKPTGSNIKIIDKKESTLEQEENCNANPHFLCINDINRLKGCKWLNDSTTSGNHCHHENYKPKESTKITTALLNK